jgi:Transposase DDE domain group 1
MSSTTTDAASIHKVRRDARGGKRGDGWRRRFERIERGDPRRLRRGKADASLTGVAGLASFGVFCREQGVDEELRRHFFRLKSGRLVVYGMESQLRLLLDANVAGEQRVFGLESLAPDPLFVHLAGGVVPSIDTVYRDLARFDATGLADLEAMMVKHGLAAVKAEQLDHIHVDVDATVEPLFGTQQDARPGRNPHYHARPSYHPILAYAAEAGVCVGALLRPGNTSLGNDDAPWIQRWLQRVRDALGRHVLVTARIDAGGDCTAILGAFHDAGSRFIAKARLDYGLREAILRVTKWTTVDRDAFDQPTRQVAVLHFHRASWGVAERAFRVIAVRTLDRDTGKQVHLWDDVDYSVQAYITNDWLDDPNEIAWEYNGRAEVEPAIAELKYGWGIGKVPSQLFAANHALFLLKLLAHNLVRRFIRWAAPELIAWRIPWLRRALINIPGRLIRSARRWSLRLPPRSRCRLE